MLESIRFNVEVSDEDEGFDTDNLEECEGGHAGAGNSVCRGSAGCYEGACDDLSRPRGTNVLIADFGWIPGTRELLALSRGRHLPKSIYDRSRVCLYVNDSYFFDDAAGQIRPLWAVALEDRSQDCLQVGVYASLREAESAYQDQVAEFLAENQCSTGMGHGFAELCDCQEAGTKERRDLRFLIPRSQHCLASTYPLTLCMCGTPLKTQAGISGHQSLGAHLDDVVDQALSGYQQPQPMTASVMARLAAGWRGSLVDLLTSASGTAEGHPATTS